MAPSYRGQRRQRLEPVGLLAAESGAGVIKVGSTNSFFIEVPLSFRSYRAIDFDVSALVCFRCSYGVV